MSSITLNTNLSYIGISQAKGVEIPLLRDQVTGTVQGASKSSKPEDKNSQAQATDKRSAAASQGQLTTEQQRQVEKLQARDREVRAHEQAHMAAGRELITSGPQYEYSTGPDGKRYAVGGEVGIDTSPEKKPEANIRKGERIQAAALAPAEPSQQDYSVAAKGSSLEEQGRSDKLQEEAQARVQQAAEAEKQREQQSQSVADQSATDQSTGVSSVQSADAASRNLSRVYGAVSSATSQTAISVFA